MLEMASMLRFFVVLEWFLEGLKWGLWMHNMPFWYRRDDDRPPGPTSRVITTLTGPRKCHGKRQWKHPWLINQMINHVIKHMINHVINHVITRIHVYFPCHKQSSRSWVFMHDPVKTPLVDYANTCKLSLTGRDFFATL